MGLGGPLVGRLVNADLFIADFPLLTEMERYDAFVRLFYSEESKDKRLLTALIASKDPLVALLMLQYLEDIPEKKALQGVLHLVERGNEVVSRAAMASYKRSHYPGKARLLKRLVLSRSPRACRFALRTLSRAGFMDILPLVVRELPDAEGAVRLEMIDALRHLPDRRAVIALSPLASSPEEPVRFAAVQALSELQGRVGGLPASFFLKRSHDASDRVRRSALAALHAYPTRKVSGLILAQAQDASEDEPSRERAIRALAAFPSRRFVRPLAAISASSGSPSLRLSVEVALRAFPAVERRAGLLPLLEDPDAGLRHAAGLLCAELSGADPEVRSKLLALWDAADDRAAVDLVEVLRALGGADAAERLRLAMSRGGLVAYAAAGALARMRGHALEALAAVKNTAISPTVHQAILSQWARRGPDESVKAELAPLLISWLSSKVINIRYLSLQILAWLPLEGKLSALLDVLTTEADPEVVATVSKQILVGLGRDPIPLALALAAHPQRSVLMGHGVRLLTAQNWDPQLSHPLLKILAAPPLDLRAQRPETYLAVCAHLMGYASVTFQDVWEGLPEPSQKKLFLKLLSSFMLDTRRRFPALPVEFLLEVGAAGDAETRVLTNALLAADDRPESTEALAASLLREADRGVRDEGAALMRGLVQGRP